MTHVRALLLCCLGAVALSAVENESTKLAVPGGCPADPGAGEFGLAVERHSSDSSFDQEGSSSDRGGTASSTDISASLLFGIIDGVDLGISLGYSRLDDEASDPDSGSGPTDIGIASTIRLGHADTWSVAIIPHVDLPAEPDPPDDALATSSDDLSWGVDLAATWESGDFTSNLVAGFTRNTGATADASDGTVWLGLAGGLVVRDWLQPEIDLVYERDLVAGDGPVWAVTGYIGAQIPTESWRGSVGFSRTLAGCQTDIDTALLASLTRLW